MKSSRTKYQELVAEFYGLGVFIVDEADLPKLAQFFERRFSELLPENSLVAVRKFLRGDRMTQYERQLKFFAMSALRVTYNSEIEPDFLRRIEYPEDKRWTLADLAEVLYGRRGDNRIYRTDFPRPSNGTYTTSEVKEILEAWKANGS